MKINGYLKKVFGAKNGTDVYQNILKLENELRKIDSSLDSIRFAIADPHGIGALLLMMQNAHIPKKYESIFLKMKKGDVCVDCGANVGLIVDIIRHQGGMVHAFEPNSDLSAFLEKKYALDDNVKIYRKAVYDRDGETEFNFPTNEDDDYVYASWCGSISNVEKLDKAVRGFYRKEIVETIDIAEFVKNDILSKTDELYLLKIDIEGAEFEVLESLIKNSLHKRIRYVVCETHERFFDDGNAKLDRIKKHIGEDGINNIFLDWV